MATERAGYVLYRALVFMYALILHIQVNFNVIMWLFLAVSTASTQFLDMQYVSVAFQLNDCLMQMACRVGG